MINNEEPPEYITEYIRSVIEILDELYEFQFINHQDDGEYEPVIDKQCKKRSIADINKELGKYKKIKTNNKLIEENCECSICADKYKEGEYKRELCCSHVFHKKCIDKWLQNNNSCPMCRKNIIN